MEEGHTMTQILFGLIAVAAGVAASLQPAANAGLAARIGLGATLVINSIIVLLGSLGFYVICGQYGSFFAADAPWGLYIGGLCGFIIILSLPFIFPKIGAAVTIALFILGQGVAALVIDHFGLLGMPKEPITLARVAGLLLVGGGLALIRA
jgi:transporter family-2 protein